MQDRNRQIQEKQIEMYFSMLPPYIQESIRQSGIQFDDVEQLRSFVSKLSRSR